MIIKNGIIASNIMTALLDHDNRFFDESTDRIDFSNVIEHDDESLELPDETLNKIRNLRVNISTRNTSQEEINDALDALGKVLDVMHLEYIHISPIGKGAPIPIDLSCLKHLNTDIENISLRNVDLSQEKPEMFDRFDSLKYVSLEKCNISNPAIVSTLGKKVRVSLKENSIAPEYFMDTVKLIQNSEAGFVFSGVELETIANAYKFKRITLSDYLKLKDTVDLSIIPNLKVSNDKDIDVEKAPEILEVLNSAENIMFECDINNLRILDPEFKLKAQTSAVIKNASDLTAEELEKRESVYSVRMEDGQNTWEQQGEPYTRDEYIAVRKEIDKIIESVEFPEEHDPDRDKKVFAQIYKALGKKISYDYYAISKEGRKDERLGITCRNLIGGLLENKAVCAGYADILRNTLACVGIHSEYAGANVDIEGGVPLDLSDPGGHAWNRVTLDGEDYWTDLTWDAPDIVAGRYPLKYCMKSTDDFNHKRFKLGINNERWLGCNETISDEKQLELFEGIVVEKSPEEKKEARAVSSLSSLCISTAKRGMTANQLQDISKEVGELCLIKPKEESREEVCDE